MCLNSCVDGKMCVIGFMYDVYCILSESSILGLEFYY